MSEKSGKLIAVWGAPHSGKTTFAASLATAIADTYRSYFRFRYERSKEPLER